ncbi:hypothetical protein [uncultured Chitinophaga sp.]|uniref:hypothetical protein n=1 Tax=uncultured Chitinophaga sp. TaxID=339340 RepID=UPI0025F6FAE2|nr:hypothetical protein [uncultured Chitinophaga sp.]
MKMLGQVSLRFEKEVLNVKSGQTVTTKLHLSNSFTDTLSGRLVLTAEGVLLLSSAVKEIKLAPGEERTFAVKFFAKEALSNNDNSSCTAAFTSVVINTGLTKKLRFVVERKRRIVLIPQELPVVIHSPQDTVRWRVQIMNRGNSNEQLHLQYSAMPGGFRFIETPFPFLLRSGEDTTVIVRALPDQQLNIVQKPQISITVNSPNNVLLASAYCMPLLVTSRYSDRGQDLMLQGNYLDLSARNLYTGTPYQEATLFSSHTNGSNALDIKLQGLYFFNQQQSLLSDSYIYLKQGRFFAKAGNISALQEVMINGQGGYAGAEISKGFTAAYTYLHDNSNQLRFNTEKNTVNVPRVTTHAVDIDFRKEEGFSFHSQFVHRNDPRDGVVSRLGSFSFNYRDKELINLQGVVGLSDETMDTTGRRYAAGAGGLDITGAAGRFSWISSAYVSGKRYAGYRRGFRFFDERFGMQLTDRVELAVRYYQQANAPELLNPVLYSFLPESDEQQSAEFSARMVLTKNFTVTVRPYRNWQDVDYRAQVLPHYKSTSNRAAVDFQLQSSSGFFATATYDIGSTRYDIDGVKANVFQSHKMNLNIGFNWLSFSGWGQIGPYYLREYANMDIVYQSYRNFQFGPMMQRSLFAGKLQLMASAQWLYQDLLPGWLTSYVARAAWQPAKHLLLHADYSLFAPGRYDFSNLGAGVSYLFSKPVGTPRAARFHLSFYEDRNNNNIRDGGEPGLKGVVVRINGNGMVSDGDGRIVFESGEKEQRIADVAAPAGWMTEPRLLLPEQRGLKVLAVSMKKSAGIAGQVQWEKGRYSQYNKAPNGWIVEAVGGNGKPCQAYVSNDGNFRLWLPPGVYDVTLKQVQPTGYFEGVPAQTIILRGNEEAQVKFLVKENNGGAIIKHFGKANQ